MPRIFVVLALAIALSVWAGAQTATGILQGRVVDATGAVVPEAKVSIENEMTGVQQSLLTNTEGNFYQSFLLPGNYRVTVEKVGFQKGCNQQRSGGCPADRFAGHYAQGG